MIAIKIRDWKPQYGLVHTATTWELALDENFEQIIETKRDEVHITFFTSDKEVPIGVTYYLRAKKEMNNGDKIIYSETVAVTGEEKVATNVITDRDVYVDAPTVHVDIDAMKLDDQFIIKTSDFRANGDQHAYTHWFILDGKDKVLWSSVYDTENLTSITVNNVDQPYAGKSKVTFRAIHGTKIDVESKPGNLVHFNKNVNFEITTPLTNVEARKDLTINFKTLDSSLRIGISKITIEDTSTNSVAKTFYDVTDSIVVPWWLLQYGSKLLLTIQCVDLQDNLIEYKKYITVSKYTNTVISNPDYKYNNTIDMFLFQDEANSKDFYIPNNFYSEPLHNGYIVLPKLNDNKLYFYELNSDNVLRLKGSFTGIDLSNDPTKEGMLIKRVGDELVMISHTIVKNNKNVHEIKFYKHNIRDGSYSEYRTVEPAGEEYGLGYTNAILQIDNNTMLYIPYKTDILKSLNLDTLSSRVLSNNIPYITTEREDLAGTSKSVTVGPVMIALGDGRVFISGGYSSNGCTYDYSSNTFQESLHWEYSSYVGNRLKSTMLINGDSIVYKTEDEVRSIQLSQSILNKDVVDSSTQPDTGTLQEIVDKVNNTTGLGETILETDQTDYIATAGKEFEIHITNNLTTTDSNQIALHYDKNNLRLVSKTTDTIKFLALRNAVAKHYPIKIICSKNQDFDQVTYENKVNYTNNIKVLDVEVEVIRDLSIDGTESATTDNSKNYYEPNLTNSESESIIILGNKYGYASNPLVLNTYLADNEDTITIPFECINVTPDELRYEYGDHNDKTTQISIEKLADNMAMIKIKIIGYIEDYTISIFNKYRQARFLDITVKTQRMSNDTIPARSLLLKPTDNSVYQSGNLLSFADLAIYNLTSDSATTIKFNNTDIAEVSTQNGNDVSFNIKRKGLTYIYLTNPNWGDKYTGVYYFINSVNLTPVIDIANPGLTLKVNNTATGDLVNNMFGYNLADTKTHTDSGYKMEITQSSTSKALLGISYKDGKFTFTTKGTTGKSNFTLKVTNLLFNESKTRTYDYEIYTEDSYPGNLKFVFDNESLNGVVNEKVYLLPFSSNPITYTVDDTKTVEYIYPDDNIFVPDSSTLANGKGNLTLIGSQDLALSNIRLLYKTKAGNAVSSILKNVVMTPVVFKVPDVFYGEVPVDNYKFLMQNGDLTEWDIKANTPNGYVVSSVRLIAKRNYTDGVKYSIRVDRDNPNLFSLKMETPDSANTLKYEFFIGFTYTNNNSNEIKEITEEYMQSIVINSVAYKPLAYIWTDNSNPTVKIGETKQLSFTHTGTYSKVTLGETGIVTLDTDTNTITGVKEGRASIIIQAGDEDHTMDQVVLYVDVKGNQSTSTLPQGDVTVTPSTIRVYKGNRIKLDIQTTGTNYKVSVEDTSIAIYDEITKKVIAKTVGETRLIVKYWGDNIVGGTKYFNIYVKDTPDNDPGILYYDSFNNELVSTGIHFEDDFYPQSTLITKEGKVILGLYRRENLADATSKYLSYYTIYN